MNISQKRIDANRRNFAKGREVYSKKRKLQKIYNYTKAPHTFVCEKCGKEFTRSITNLDYDKHRWPRHCSRSCANGRVRSAESKAKISAKLIGIRYVNGIPVKIKPTVCKCCGKEFYIKHGSSRVFCSPECKDKYNRMRRESAIEKGYAAYRAACAFKFKLNQYPDEFDFDLIKQYGWYKPKNKGDNPNGVSRDHIFSVWEGYHEHVSPDIISHPANCRLMRHTDNISKYTKCSITLDELKEKIKLWDAKYNTSTK